jgi:hypothetical protein
VAAGLTDTGANIPTRTQRFFSRQRYTNLVDRMHHDNCAWITGGRMVGGRQAIVMMPTLATVLSGSPPWRLEPRSNRDRGHR